MTVLNVKIEPPLSDFIEGLVKEGRYPSADAAVADLIAERAVMEAETPEYTAWHKAEIQKGEDDIKAGRVVDWDPDAIMREVERRYAAK